MRKVFLILLTFFITACSKSKTVLICGDHICINKTEAKQFFEENLVLEVKIIDGKKENNFDLLELNLNESNKQKREVSIRKIDEPKKEIKNLSKKEIIQIKSEIKNKQKLNKLSKKIENRDANKSSKKNSFNENNVNKSKNNFTNSRIINKDVIDICKIVEKCSIDEISKYLIKHNEKKGFPNISVKQ